MTVRREEAPAQAEERHDDMTPVDTAIDRIESVNTDFRIMEDNTLCVSVPDAKDRLIAVCTKLQPLFKWTDDYAGVARWLTDNKGKGLVLAGNYGTGKTLIAKAVCVVIYQAIRRIPLMVSATDLGKKIDVVKNACGGIVYIDDVGWEQESVEYGRRFMAFSETVDEVTKKNGLLIVSTNFSMDQMKTKYGERIYDRLKFLANITVFSGPSHRATAGVI